MARKLYAVGLFTAHKKWVVIGLWLLAAGVLLASMKAFGSNTTNNLDLPGTDSEAATELLAEQFPPQQNGANPLVMHTATGTVTAGKYRDAVQSTHEALKQIPHVYSAPSPYTRKGSAQISDDKQTAFIPVLLNIGNAEISEAKARTVLDAAEPAREAGMEVAVGGQIGSELSEPATESSEVVGLTAAMIILAFTFGTFVAMGLPIVSAVAGLVVRPLGDRAARPHRRRAVDRADAGDDDRARRRHRLRALPGQPLPIRARRGQGDRRLRSRPRSRPRGRRSSSPARRSSSPS